jgi:hypothetical protein
MKEAQYVLTNSSKILATTAGILVGRLYPRARWPRLAPLRSERRPSLRVPAQARWVKSGPPRHLAPGSCGRRSEQEGGAEQADCGDGERRADEQ